MVFCGVAFVGAAWLAGSTRPAYALRGALAPVLRYRLAASYGALAILFLLLLAWDPIPATHKPLGILLFAALLVLGLELLRRQTAREFPDVQPGDSGKRLKAWLSGARTSVAGTAGARKARRGQRDTVTEATALTGRFDELEKLAALHDRGVLSDEEFDSQKVLILSRS
jgi:hypothetical protein